MLDRMTEINDAIHYSPLSSSAIKPSRAITVQRLGCE